MAIDYRLKATESLHDLARLLETLPDRYAVKTQSWLKLKVGGFHDNHTVVFQDKNSFWVGIGLNSAKTEWLRIRLEFNSNKCASHAAFLEILSYLNANSRQMYTEIKRFDLALDIPALRENVSLIKDRRVYSERRHGEEFTQYLGAKSSTVGRVKLYNKQIEANLSQPLTRYEITLDPNVEYKKIPWARVYYITASHIALNEMQLRDTDRFILGALLEGYGHITDLGRKTRAKMEQLLTGYTRFVNISEADYELVLKHLRLFLDYPKTDLGIELIDLDQPQLSEFYSSVKEVAPLPNEDDFSSENFKEGVFD
jgi:hypothetical protein